MYESCILHLSTLHKILAVNSNFTNSRIMLQHKSAIVNCMSPIKPGLNNSLLQKQITHRTSQRHYIKQHQTISCSITRESKEKRTFSFFTFFSVLHSLFPFSTSSGSVFAVNAGTIPTGSSAIFPI